MMASHIKTQLTQISTSAGGTHRDLAEKYKVVLEAILKLGEDELVEFNEVYVLCHILSASRGGLISESFSLFSNTDYFVLIPSLY